MNFVRIVLSTLILFFSFSTGLGDGLPGEYLLSDKWRQVFASQSPVDNPAFIMEESHLKVRGVFSFSSGDPARLWELGVVLPIDLYNTVGLTIMGESGHEVVGVSFNGSDLIENGKLNNNNLLFMGSYAINPWRKISIGTNLNLAYQGNFGEPEWGFGADLGVNYRITMHPLLGHHLVGLSYRNLFSPKINSAASMPFSSQIKTQYHASLWKNKLSIDWQISMSDINSQSMFFSGARRFDWDMEMQVGVSPVPNVKVIAFTDINQWNDLGSFGLVCGVNMPNANNGKELSFLYQYRQNIHTDLLGSHSLYSSAQFGPHREQLYAQRLAQSGIYAYNNLYTQGLTDYYNKNYWDAYFAFSRLHTQYPEFLKSDAVAFYAASCLENLDMRSAAINAYQKLKEQYPESEYAAQADLGILRIYYRDAKFKKVKEHYQEMMKKNISDSIKEHAAYYMGETEIYLNNHENAIQYFEMIKDSHPLYSFAQHSLATVNVLLDSSNEKIKSHLLNAIDGQSETQAQKEIINRSLILLGYLYYEEKLMSKAVIALRMVSNNSYYYEDAQLGLGWAAVKSRQWHDCIIVGQQIYATSKKPVIQSEGLLLQAYGYLQQKQYTKAEELLAKATEQMEKYTIQSSADETNSDNYNNNRIRYDSLATEVTKTATQFLYGDLLHEKIKEMHKLQITIKSSIDESIKYSDEFKRTRFFERTFLKLKEDLEYALVTVLRIRSSDADKEILKQKQKNIDEQIDDLRDKIEDLQIKE